MARRIRVHPQAADDLEDAIAWYEAISFELSNRFRENVKQCLKQIRERPESFGLLDASLRAARVRGFPYSILFKCSTNYVEILHVSHSSADPHRWRPKSQ